MSKSTEAEEPQKETRVRYRNIEDGNAGYREGNVIVLDRPNERIEFPYHEQLWMVDKETHPLSKMQLAMVAYAADAALCRVLNQRHLNDGEWLNLGDKKRIAWVNKGPQKGTRGALYAYVMQALKPLGEDS